MRALTTDFTRQDSRPYFLWDEDTSIAELGAALSGTDECERQRLLGKMLREARETLVSRQEFRDLVDVLELERLGLRVEAFLAEASAKDGGCTPATLAWLLNEWQLPANLKLPTGYQVEQLRRFKEELAERMAIAAHPKL